MKNRLLTVLLLALLAAPLFAGAAVASGPGFAAGPYLLEVTQDSATVAFHLSRSLPARVLVHKQGTIRVFHSPVGLHHFVRVTGLEPSRTYMYEVVCEDPGPRTPPADPSYAIKTACEPGESYVFAVYGDPRPGETGTNRHHDEVIRQVALADPAFCLVLGDLVDQGQNESEWLEFFRIESPVARRSALYPVLGDNDLGKGPSAAPTYFPMLKKGYYSFTWGGSWFFALNAWDATGNQPRAELDVDSPQIRWLEEELSRPEVRAAPFRIVFTHDPVMISRGRASELIQRVWAPLFEKYGVDAVFASWHLYERSHYRGVAYVISGGAGAEILWMPANPAFTSQASARRHHFVRVDASAGAMTVRAVATDGTVLDAFTLTPKARGSREAERLSRRAARLGEKFVVNSGAGPVLPVELFSYACSYCRRLKENILPEMAKKHGVTLSVTYFDLGKKGSDELFFNAASEFRREGADLPAIFAGRRVFGGETEIESLFPDEIERFKKNPEAYRASAITPFQSVKDVKTLKEEAFQALTLGLVFGAGLLDGLNPCAFATIIFLVSYLGLFGASFRQTVATGVFFTLGVFLTYLAIGLLFFHSLKHVLANPGLGMAVETALFFLVLVLFLLSVRDGVKSLQGKAGEALLKLPPRFQEAIQARIRGFAGKGVFFSAAPFFLGVAVSSLELTCTGQVYLPIVTMISDPAHRARAVFYLFVYNLAFILPLVAVFVMALTGVTGFKAAKSARVQAGVRFAFAAFFALMAGILAFNLGWI